MSGNRNRAGAWKWGWDFRLFSGEDNLSYIYFKIRLFVISLIPLFFIFIIQTIKKPTYIMISFKNIIDYFIKDNIIVLFWISLIVIGSFFVLSFNSEIKGGIVNPKTIKKVRNINYEHLTFLTTYIIPIISFQIIGIRSLILVIVLLIFIACLYIKTNLYYANPTLAVLGFHIYKVDTENIDELIVITKDKLKEGNQFFYKKFGENICFGKLKLPE